MNKNDNHKELRRFMTIATVLFGLIAGGVITSQNNVSASHVRHTRTKRVARKPLKRTRRVKVQRRRTKTARQVKRAKRTRKVRRMVKHAIRRKGHGRRKQLKTRKEIRPMRIEHRETDKDPISISPKNDE